MAKPVLNLQTLIERPIVEIDDEQYEIASPDELSVVDLTRYGQWGAEITALSQKKKLTSKKQDRLTELLHRLTNGIMVGVPPDVRAKLKDPQRLAVAEVFTVLQLTAKLKTLKPAAANQTGANKPRGSKGSTAARRTGGSTKRRSPSSGPTPQ